MEPRALDELSKVSGVSKRAIRRYIAEKMVRRGKGRTSNTRYDADHLMPLLRIKPLADQGLTLKEIQSALKAQKSDTAQFGNRIGDRLDGSLIAIGKGVVVGFLSPRNLSADQERRLLTEMRKAYQEVLAMKGM